MVVVALKFIIKKDLVRQIMLTILKMKVCSGESSVELATRSHIDCTLRHRARLVYSLLRLEILFDSGILEKKVSRSGSGKLCHKEYLGNKLKGALHHLTFRVTGKPIKQIA